MMIIPCTVASKRIKYVGINQPEELKDLYLENYETLMKEIEILQAGEDIQYSWIERITIVKMTIPATHSFSAIPIKLSVAFFTELERIV